MRFQTKRRTQSTAVRTRVEDAGFNILTYYS